MNKPRIELFPPKEDLEALWELLEKAKTESGLAKQQNIVEATEQVELLIDAYETYQQARKGQSYERPHTNPTNQRR